MDSGAMRVNSETVEIIAAWADGIEVEEINPENGQRLPALNIQCGEDVKRASLGDWVVQKEDGTFDVMGPNTFLHSHFD